MHAYYYLHSQLPANPFALLFVRYSPPRLASRVLIARLLKLLIESDQDIKFSFYSLEFISQHNSPVAPRHATRPFQFTESFRGELFGRYDSVTLVI